MNENMDSLSADGFIRKMCEEKTVFRLNGDAFGSYRTMDILYCPRIQEHLFSEYADRLEEVLNETHGEMVSDEIADDDRVMRLCKTQTLVVMKDSPAGDYSYFETPFSPEFKKKLVKIHGCNIVEFVNERFSEKKE